MLWAQRELRGQQLTSAMGPAGRGQQGLLWRCGVGAVRVRAASLSAALAV